MRVEVIFCPSCNHKLRVPHDLMGAAVECPECGATFDAPPLPPPEDQPRDSSALPPPQGAPPSERFDDRATFPDRPLAPPTGRGSLKIVAPGLAVVASGLIHGGLNIVVLIVSIRDPQFLVKQWKPFIPAVNNDVFAKVNIAFAALFALLSFAQVIGGIAMIRSRGFALAALAAFFATINCNTLCCLLSIPAGIWALIVLFMPDVRATFDAP